MKPVAKRLVVAALLEQGCRKLSERGIHEKWGCPCGQHTTAVPRHAELSAGVARKIQRHMACLPEGWLQ
jgi:predicted RNA binding protein YcfA (HicA-like mRNA interferase family)